MQNGCREGRGDKRGTRSTRKAQSITGCLLSPPLSKLLNTYFERMGDEGHLKPWAVLPFPRDRRDYYAVSWLQKPFLDRGQQQRVHFQKSSGST